MKKNKIYILSALIAGSLLFWSCGSSKTENEEVISTVAANHIIVQQTNSKVKIILTKTEAESISAVKVTETEDKTCVTVPLTSENVSFEWPFAENGKEYQLRADLLDKEGKTISSEYVSFKSEATPAAVTYSEAFENSKLVLIAKGNERTVKFNSSQDTLKDVTVALKTAASDLKIDIYSGKKTDADSNLTPVATLVKQISNKAALQEVFDGYDLIKNAALFGMTPSEMNAALSKNKTYYAVATVVFEMEGSKGLKFNSKQLMSNETIYTPIAEQDLKAIEESVKPVESQK